MTRRIGSALIPVLGIILLSTVAACHRDPHAMADQAMTRGDRYLSARQFDEAVIEYRRAIQLVPERTDAHLKLARTYLERGDRARAYAEFSRATDLDARLVDAQVGAGNLLLESGDFDEAKVRAEQAISVDPRDSRARILLGNALAGLHDNQQALRQMEQAVALDPSSPEVYSALGSIQFAVASPSAGASFQKAVALQPRSIDTRVALANYHWAAGDHAAAEDDLRAALDIDASSVPAHRALALMYTIDGRPADAEPQFKALASTSADGRLALADFYVGTERLDEALALLGPLATDPELGRVAQMRTAGVLRRQGHRDQALRVADQLIRARPSDPDARSLKARLLLTPPVDANAAWTEANLAVKANADSASAQYSLGLAAVARRDTSAAQAAFTRTLALDPGAEAAQVQLARLALARGDAAAAENAAEDAVNARPDDADAALVLIQSLRAGGELDRARREVSARVQKTPDRAPFWVELARIELAAHRPAEARQALDRARAASPNDEDAQVVAGQLAAASDTGAGVEAQLLDVIRAHPERLDAYETLAAYYANHARAADALARYQTLAARAPDQPGPATMVGILMTSTDRAGARAQYEAVLANHPRAPVAANNLAWMLAEDGRYDDALRWATVAADGLRGRPEPQDTLGWIYLKTDRPADALAAFERAASAAPGEPLYAQHVAQARLALRRPANR